MSDSKQASLQLLESAAADLDAVFTSLRELGEALALAQRAAAAADRPLKAADLDSLRPMLRDELRRHDSLLAGTGVLPKPGLLGDVPMFVEWWCAGPIEPFPLRVSLDPDHPIFSDYDTFEWFEGPWAEGSTRIAGPWVDYTATGEHVMTLSVPIFGEAGEFLGVAGADVLARRIERIALEPLRSIPEEAALISADGRILVSNTSRLLTGALLAESDAEWVRRSGQDRAERTDGVAAIKHAALPWAVITYPVSRA